ncbi:hypothetical protein [Methylobacterium oryzae]|uniref:hypothetical protein n=1 Tax=Methylobacterium oryzae TaxID=334852 RepID=UPI002F35128D
MTDHREPPPIRPEDLPHVVADLQAQAQAQFEEKQVKTIIEVTTKSFDRATTYANVILVAGYAGAFTIWSFTRSQLPAKAGVAIALALLISLAAFIAFEVVKMTLTSNITLRSARVLHGNAPPTEKIQAIKMIENAQASILMKMRWYWVATMVIAVGGAIVALVLLASNFVAVLIGLSGWPI